MDIGIIRIALCGSQFFLLAFELLTVEVCSCKLGPTYRVQVLKWDLLRRHLISKKAQTLPSIYCTYNLHSEIFDPLSNSLL